MFAIDLGKYKNIFISIALFLILDASVLILNFYISFEIADDAVSINLAGRQRMLSQRMTKSLLDTEYSYGLSEERASALQELRLSRNLFDETLTAFDKGGVAKGAGGNIVELNRAEDTDSLEALAAGKLIWATYKEKIDRVLDHQGDKRGTSGQPTFESPIERADLNEAIRYGRENNLSLLALMNDLTVSLENVAASKAQRLRLIQTAGILMALINFFIIMFHFIRQLRQGDKVIDAARKENVEILSTVNEGLFLVDKEFNIGSQRSNKLYEILNISPNDDINFERLLRDIVSAKDLESAQGFLRLLFNPKIKEKLIGGLNPLDKIQVNLDNGVGNYESKYLRFDFKRVMQRDVIADVLVTVNDITRNVELEIKLQQERERNDSQITMLTSILHTDPSLLNKFLDNSYRCFSNINNLLKKTAKNQNEFSAKINAIFVEIHNFKGEAGALELTDFVSISHEFENHLDIMRKSSLIRGQDFLSLTVLLDKLINYAQSITQLVDKIGGYNQTSEVDNSRLTLDKDATYSWAHLQKMVTDLSSHYKKEVMLVTSGLYEADIPDNLRDTINSLCIQFLRNAIVHGIEHPDERKNSHKSEDGRVDIRLSITPKRMLEFVISDNGAGIDYEKILEQAVSTGKWTRRELESWDQKRLLSLIFEPGFSTASQVDENAGRGVGMDLVLAKIKQFRGKIKIHSRRGQFSRFTVTFPLSRLPNKQVA